MDQNYERFFTKHCYYNLLKKMLYILLYIRCKKYSEFSKKTQNTYLFIKIRFVAFKDGTIDFNSDMPAQDSIFHCDMDVKTFNEFSFMSSIDSKLFPRSGNFSFGNRIRRLQCLVNNPCGFVQNLLHNDKAKLTSFRTCRTVSLPKKMLAITL